MSVAISRQGFFLLYNNNTNCGLSQSVLSGFTEVTSENGIGDISGGVQKISCAFPLFFS
jgi:hypothetical protein